MKQDKYLKMAFAHFGYKSEIIMNENDLKTHISEFKDVIEKCENQITRLEEIKKDSIETMELYNDVLIQIEIEKYKEMNPKAEVFAVY